MDFTIGREQGAADIVPLGDYPESVSRCHAHIRADLEHGTFRVEDLGSTNGTYVYQGTAWERILKGILDLDVPVRFGYLETTFRALLPDIQELAKKRSQALPTPQTPQHAPEKSSHPHRDPLTGEIIE